MCCKIVQWLLILRPRHRYLIAHQLALQVRVDGQSSSDTVEKMDHTDLKSYVTKHCLTISENTIIT